jgi:hypothetical protein
MDRDMESFLGKGRRMVTRGAWLYSQAAPTETGVALLARLASDAAATAGQAWGRSFEPRSATLPGGHAQFVMETAHSSKGAVQYDLRFESRSSTWK